MDRKNVQVFVDGKLVLEGPAFVESEQEGEIELIVETENGHQYIVQVPE